MEIELNKPEDEMPEHSTRILMWGQDVRTTKPDWYIGYLGESLMQPENGMYFFSGSAEIDVIYWAYLEEPE